MNIQEFLSEYSDLTEERQIRGMTDFLNELLRDPEQYEDFILEMLDIASNLEQDDYFGTEGMDI